MSTPKASPRGYPGHTVPGSPRPLRVPPARSHSSLSQPWFLPAGATPPGRSQDTGAVVSPPPGRTPGGWMWGVPGRGGGQGGRPQPPALRPFRRRRCWTAPPAAPPPAPPPRAGVTPRPDRCHLPPVSHPEPEHALSRCDPFPPSRCHSPRSSTASPSRCSSSRTSVASSSPCPSPPHSDAHRAAYSWWCLFPSGHRHQPAEGVPRDQPRARGPRPLGCLSGTEPSVPCLVPSVPQQCCLLCPSVPNSHREKGWAVPPWGDIPTNPPQMPLQ